MDMIFDTATGQLTINTDAVQPWGADLRAVLDRHGNAVNLRGVEMRLTLTADAAEIFDLQLPPAGVRYTRTDQDIIATGRVVWAPDQQIAVNAWCKTAGGQELTATANFTAPRPAQPYPSWTWDGTSWVAPAPYPDDGQEYVWDEANQEWILA
jgi:hypothetical protein